MVETKNKNTYFGRLFSEPADGLMVDTVLSLVHGCKNICVIGGDKEIRRIISQALTLDIDDDRAEILMTEPWENGEIELCPERSLVWKMYDPDGADAAIGKARMSKTDTYLIDTVDTSELADMVFHFDDYSRHMIFTSSAETTDDVYGLFRQGVFCKRKLALLDPLECYGEILELQRDIIKCMNIVIKISSSEAAGRKKRLSMDIFEVLPMAGTVAIGKVVPIVVFNDKLRSYTAVNRPSSCSFEQVKRYAPPFRIAEFRKLFSSDPFAELPRAEREDAFGAQVLM